jgi:hypothetical protein
METSVNRRASLECDIENRRKLERKLSMLSLEVAFLGGVALVATQDVTIDLWLYPVLALATFRLARTISFNEIAEVIREPFTEVKQDSCGAGSNVHPRGNGVRRVIGGLLACPICTGTWAALFLVAVYTFFPQVGRVLISVLGIAGASELLHWLAETLEWTGRRNRVQAGKISPDQE